MYIYIYNVQSVCMRLKAVCFCEGKPVFSSSFMDFLCKCVSTATFKSFLESWSDLGVIHLVRTQRFLRNYVCVPGDKKC